MQHNIVLLVDTLADDVLRVFNLYRFWVASTAKAVYDDPERGMYWEGLRDWLASELDELIAKTQRSDNTLQFIPPSIMPAAVVKCHEIIATSYIELVIALASEVRYAISDGPDNEVTCALVQAHKDDFRKIANQIQQGGLSVPESLNRTTVRRSAVMRLECSW